MYICYDCDGRFERAKRYDHYDRSEGCCMTPPEYSCPFCGGDNYEDEEDIEEDDDDEDY